MTLTLAGRRLSLLRGWHVHSQVGSCRNALVASTALAERRREHLEVEQFLADHIESRTKIAVVAQSG